MECLSKLFLIFVATFCEKCTNMKKIFILQILVTIILPCASLCARPSYRLPEFKHLVTMLRIQEDSLCEGKNYFHTGKMKVYVDVRKNLVADMGYVVFSDDLKAAANTPILNFLERYFLLLDYPKPDHTRQKMLQEDRFRFITGNSNTLRELLPTDEFSYNGQRRIYEAAWRRDGRTLLSVSFPAEHQLISGEDKIQAEANFQNDALSATIPEVAGVSEEELTPTLQKDYFIMKGSTYMNNKLNSDLYYHKQEGAYRLLASVSHPMESAANMMIGTDYNERYNLKVSQVLYGFKKKTYDLPLRNWIAFCRNNGCTLYYGIESMDEQTIKATVIAVNTAENYNHLLFVNIPLSAIDTGRGDIEAKLETYIPMHNVLNIFAKYRKVKNKNKKMYE